MRRVLEGKHFCCQLQLQNSFNLKVLKVYSENVPLVHRSMGPIDLEIKFQKVFQNFGYYKVFVF